MGTLNMSEIFEFTDHLTSFFEESAAAGGVTLDAELCSAFAEGLTDFVDKFDALVGLVRAAGLVERVETRRSRAASEQLARSIVAEAAGKSVVALPECHRVLMTDDGGDAS